MDAFTKKMRLTTIEIPVAMTCMEKNTAECQVAVMEQTMRKIPEYKGFKEVFRTQVRMAVVDRFGANGRGEEYLKSNDEHSISTVFGCEIHKAASSMKRSLAIDEDTVSGVLQIGLSNEGAGTLQKLRSLLGDVFRTSLVIVYDEPPTGTILEHRQSVLDTFLPITQKSPDDPTAKFQVNTRKRRFILGTLANSDIRSGEVIHYCGWGCCSSAEESVFMFERYVCWALLPSKCPVLSRKSWTGAGPAFDWCGLLQSHWNLLTVVMERFVGNPIRRPIPDDQDDMAFIEGDPSYKLEASSKRFSFNFASRAGTVYRYRYRSKMA